MMGGRRDEAPPTRIKRAPPAWAVREYYGGFRNALGSRMSAFREAIPGLTEEEGYEWAMAERAAFDRQRDSHVPPIGDWNELDRDEKWGALGYTGVHRDIILMTFKGWEQTAGILLTKAQIDRIAADPRWGPRS